MSETAELPDSLKKVGEARGKIHAELSKKIIGQEDVIDLMIIALFAKGHCLLTGVPGLGKTQLVKSLAQIFSLQFSRIQFTPDLMPSDIIGTDVLEEDPETGKRRFEFIKGPVFSQILLADEINRTPPKTQAALLEAMEERQLTTGGHRYELDPPFFVLATQNPIELEGTYPLPEAQLDRFLFNVVLNYLSTADEEKMVIQTTNPESAPPESLFSAEEILEIQSHVRDVPAAEPIVSYAVRLVSASRRGQDTASSFVNEYVKWGAGSRASQALILGGKARALLHGRYNVSCEDIRALAKPVLRHRIMGNFHADAAGIDSDAIIDRILDETPE